MTAEMVNEALSIDPDLLEETVPGPKEEPVSKESNQKPKPPIRFTEFVDSKEYLDSIDADEPINNNPLTNEVFEALFIQSQEEDDEPIVPSRPAGEYGLYTPPTVETVHVSPNVEVDPTSTVAAIQKQRQFFNKRTRSILASVGIGIAIGLTGVAIYSHYYESPNQKQADH